VSNGFHVATLPSLNRACSFPAHGFPIFFTARHTLSSVRKGSIHSHKHQSSCGSCHRSAPSTRRIPLDDRPSSNGWLFFCPTYPTLPMMTCPLSQPASVRETGLLLRYPMFLPGLRPCPGELLVNHPRHSISPILSGRPIFFPTQPTHGITVALHAAKRRGPPPLRRESTRQRRQP